VIEPLAAEFPDLLEHFPRHPHPRSIIVVDVARVTDSCGYGVPIFRYEGERQQLVKWSNKAGQEGLQSYRERKNRSSIDGLPGVFS